MSTSAPRVNTVNAFTGQRPTGLFRAMSEADDYVRQLDGLRELQTRVQELEAENAELREAAAASGRGVVSLSGGSRDTAAGTGPPPPVPAAPQLERLREKVQQLTDAAREERVKWGSDSSAWQMYSGVVTAFATVLGMLDNLIDGPGEPGGPW